MRALTLLLLLLAPLAGRGAINDVPPQTGAASTYEDIRAACNTLLQAGSQGNITVLSKYYAATTNTEVREAITAVSGLFWMIRQHLGNAERDAECLRKNFPDSQYQCLLDKDANLIACTNCHDGVALVTCPDCGGTAKCRACGGRGKVAGIVGSSTTLGADNLSSFAKPNAVGAGSTRTLSGSDPQSLSAHPPGEAATLIPCSLCGGNGICPTCKGAKVVKGRCPICQGFGTVFTPRTRLVYMDMLKHLHDLAFAASMAERGKILMEGRWLDTSAATQLLQRRREERADFARVTAEAERATNYPTAFQLLDNVLIRHPDSTYTADVQRVIAMLHAEAADKKITDKAVRGAEQIAAANNNPQREIGIIVEAVLVACRRGTNEPLFIASQSKPVLPENPERWQIGEPELIGRTARVSVQIDRPSRSGFLKTEPWELRLVYENIQWKVWQTVGPEQPVIGH